MLDTPGPISIIPGQVLLQQLFDKWSKSQPEVMRLHSSGAYLARIKGHEIPCLLTSEPDWVPVAYFPAPGAPIKMYSSAKHHSLIFPALTLLAIEHGYTPWLHAAKLFPYTGAAAAAAVIAEPVNAWEAL